MKGLIKFLFSATAGVLYGILFAQKPGKKLRSELKKSKNPTKTLVDELKNIDLEALGMTKDWAQNSEELQKVIETGKEQFDTLVKKIKTLDDNALEQAGKELEKLAKNAKTAVKQLKKKGTKLKKDAKKTVKKIKKKGTGLKKDAKKVVKNVVKNVKK